MKDLSIIVCWEAWYWVESLSKALSLFFMREGYSVFTNSEYENRIRWWHIYTFMRIWSEEVTCYKSTQLDMLFVMDKVWIEKHQERIREWWVVIYDSGKIKDIWTFRQDLKYIPVEMQNISTKLIWMPLARNVVWAWAILWAISYDWKWFKDVLAEIFKKKWDDVINNNYKAFDMGYEKVKESGINLEFNISPDKSKKRFLMHWNESIVLWALKAWMKYLSAYPMTPWSSVMTTAAKEAKNFNIVVSHVEDEIAAICNIVWAWYAWIRSMTSTSWWWFSLMWEALGLSWMIEAPCVIVNAQRPWPSTGLPTMTEQGDLSLAIGCWQWDYPKLVIAPWDHEECIRLSFEAFNYAEKFQLPVVLLTEKYLADSYKSIDFIDFKDWTWNIERWELAKDIKVEDEYKRFKLTDTWVSPRSIPWVKNWVHTVTSYEHDEFWKAEEQEDKIIAMVEKRWAKQESLKSCLPMPNCYWDELSDITLVWWWATKWVLLEVLWLLKEKWISAKLIHFQYLFPFKWEIEGLLKQQKKLVSVETNYSGQFAWLITQETWIKMDQQIKSFTGKQITASYVAKELNL